MSQDSVFEQIKQIPVSQILNRLGIKYREDNGTFYLYEDNKETDGWRANINGTFKDFSRERGSGDRITFIMEYLSKTKKEALDWYEESFSLKHNPQNMSNSIENNVKNKWETLTELDGLQIAYLKERGIDYSLLGGIVKSFGGRIACRVKNVFGDILTIQSRKTNEKVYTIMKGTPSKGCFFEDIDQSEKKVYVVEGMTDFLTLRQFKRNVLGLKSALDGFEVVEGFYKKGYEIVLIPDNDEPGKGVQKHLEEMNIKYSLFDISVYEDDENKIKDLNDLLNYTGLGSEIVDLIESDRTREPENIDIALSKLFGLQDIIKTRGKLGYDGPFKEIDKYTQGIIEGTVYTIGAYANTGKSQLSYEYTQHLLKLGKKVLYFSTEIGIGYLIGYISKAFYKKSHRDIMRGRVQINKDDFKNLKIYDDVMDLESIEKITKQEKADAVFIDFAQNIYAVPGTEYENMSAVARGVQLLSTSTNSTVFMLSQVNNDSRGKDGDSMTLKGSGALMASSDVVLGLYRENSQLKLQIVKNKFGNTRIKYNLSSNFDIGTWKIQELAEDEMIGF